MTSHLNENKRTNKSAAGNAGGVCQYAEATASATAPSRFLLTATGEGSAPAPVVDRSLRFYCHQPRPVPWFERSA